MISLELPTYIKLRLHLVCKTGKNKEAGTQVPTSRWHLINMYIDVHINVLVISVVFKENRNILTGNLEQTLNCHRC
jgi:hypothetical protein